MSKVLWEELLCFYLFMMEKNKQIKEKIFRDALLLTFSATQNGGQIEQATSRLLWQQSDRWRTTRQAQIDP